MSTPLVEPRTDLASRVDDLLRYIAGGRILEAMDEFYADEASMQENNNPPTVGRAANIEREKQFLAYVKQWKRFDVRAVALDLRTGTAMIQSELEFDAVDGKTIRVDQVAVQTWRDGRIAHEKFYYDSAAK